VSATIKSEPWFDGSLPPKTVFGRHRQSANFSEELKRDFLATVLDE